VDVGVAFNSGTSVVGYREQAGIAAAPAVATDDSPPTQDATPAVFIDPQTNTIVYQVLDTNTGDVIEQVLAPPLLRQLAYDRAQAVRALIHGNNLNTATQKIDTTS
jgi:hypothetical protein